MILVYLGDNRIQNVHLGWYSVGGAVKRNFRPYNRWYTSPNEHFEYGYPHPNTLFNIYSSKAKYFAPNWSFVSNVRQLRQPITIDVTYDVGAATVYRRVYWRKFLTLSSQTLRYIRKCIRMSILYRCRYCIHLRKLTCNNPILDLVNINAYAIFGQIPLICSQDNEQKRNSDLRKGP